MKPRVLSSSLRGLEAELKCSRGKVWAKKLGRRGFHTQLDEGPETP